mgnify:CR=1 FL=1
MSDVPEKRQLYKTEEIRAIPHEFVEYCINPHCNLHRVDVTVHGDDIRGSHLDRMSLMYSVSEDAVLERRKFSSEMNACDECKCQRHEKACFEAPIKDIEYWEQKALEIDAPMVITPTSKSSPNYYKRWKSKEGGSPDFNPVSNTGGRGSREGTMEEINKKKATPMEIDMDVATRKVQRK